MERQELIAALKVAKKDKLTMIDLRSNLTVLQTEYDRLFPITEPAIACDENETEPAIADGNNEPLDNQLIKSKNHAFFTEGYPDQVEIIVYNGIVYKASIHNTINVNTQNRDGRYVHRLCHFLSNLKDFPEWKQYNADITRLYNATNDIFVNVLMESLKEKNPRIWESFKYHVIEKAIAKLCPIFPRSLPESLLPDELVADWIEKLLNEREISILNIASNRVA